MMWSLSPRRLGLARSSFSNTEIRRIANEIVVRDKRSGGGGGLPGLLWGQRREYIYPRSLDKVENIETLKEYNEQKEKMVMYRKSRHDSVRKKRENPRPKRPRNAIEVRRKWFAARDALWKEVEGIRLKEHPHLQWESSCAVLLERLPIITSELPKWEQDMLDLQGWKWWTQGGKWPESMQEFNHEDDSEPPPTIKELYEESPVPLAPRITSADKTNDRTTLNRALADRIFLLLRKCDDENGEAQQWTFLQGPVEQGDKTLRSCAERIAKNFLEEPFSLAGADYWHVGNAPAGWDWSVYKKEFEKLIFHNPLKDEEQEARGAFGRRTFFMRAQLLAFKEEPKFMGWDHVWVTEEEMRDYVRNKNEGGKNLEPDLPDYLHRLL